MAKTSRENSTSFMKYRPLMKSNRAIAELRKIRNISIVNDFMRIGLYNPVNQFTNRKIGVENIMTPK